MAEDLQMSPKRPYLFQAMFDWLLDNGTTPHMVVDATFPGTQVPEEFVQEGQIVLNVHPDAVRNFQADLEVVRFHARFGGRPQDVFVPFGAIVALYARENGAGTIFEPEPGLQGQDSGPAEAGKQTTEASGPALEPVQGKEPEDANENGEVGDEQTEKPQQRPQKGKPNLKVIK